jgi:formylglycine-generating enzyme required for sulfatase activity
VDRRLPRRLIDARLQTDRLFAILEPAALYDRPIPERHRIVFYVGHLEAFDWNLLRAGHAPFHPAFDQLFAFGIDPVGGGLPTDQPADWPSVEEVKNYARKTREQLDAALPECSDLVLNVAIEHRLMHAETLAYMFHRLPLDKKRRPENDGAALPALPREPGMIEVPAGAVTLGLSRESGQFGWDNEFEAHIVDVPAFLIDRYKVTNGEYLEFVRAGGPAPVFWNKKGQEWLYRSMFHEIPLPLEWPVYVSHEDASAYAEWAGKSLPTEAQWQRAACGAPRSGNFDFARWDPVPVTAFGGGASGVQDMWGNGWEWTSTLFAPFPGFQPFPFYPGYSANFFDGQHYVMKGGSARTAACMLRPSFRNWFQPHYPYVYAGFRCVSNA